MPIQKWSVLDLAPIYEGVDPACALKQAVLLAQTAEQLGYCRYWAAEHHDMPGLASSTPEVLLAHIGAQTHRIRIGSEAVLLPVAFGHESKKRGLRRRKRGRIRLRPVHERSGGGGNHGHYRLSRLRQETAFVRANRQFRV